MIKFVCDYKDCDAEVRFYVDRMDYHAGNIELSLTHGQSAGMDYANDVFGFTPCHGLLFCDEHTKETKEAHDLLCQRSSDEIQRYYDSVTKD